MKIEKKMYAQVRYFETLYKIKDANGEVIFTGSEEMAKKLMLILSKQDLKRRTVAMIKRRVKRKARK